MPFKVRNLRTILFSLTNCVQSFVPAMLLRGCAIEHGKSGFFQTSIGAPINVQIRLSVFLLFLFTLVRSMWAPKLLPYIKAGLDEVTAGFTSQFAMLQRGCAI